MGARSALERILTLTRGASRSQDPSRLAAMSSLAVLHHEEGNLAEARQLQQDAVEVKTETLKALLHLSEQHQQDHEWSRSPTLAEKVVELRRKASGAA